LSIAVAAARACSCIACGPGVITLLQGELAPGGQRQGEAPPVAELAEGPGRVVQSLAGLADGPVHQRPAQPEQRVGAQPVVAQLGSHLDRAG
jgi:hypothetical protein